MKATKFLAAAVVFVAAGSAFAADVGFDVGEVLARAGQRQRMASLRPDRHTIGAVQLDRAERAYFTLRRNQLRILRRGLQRRGGEEAGGDGEGEAGLLEHCFHVFFSSDRSKRSMTIWQQLAGRDRKPTEPQKRGFKCKSGG